MANTYVPSTLVDLCLITVSKHLDGCKILNTLPDALRQRLFKAEFESFQTDVTDLSLSHCYTFTDDEAKNLKHLKNLQKLNLAHCDKLTGYALFTVCQLPQLETLILAHCTKVSVGFYSLPQLKNLTTLELSFCEIRDPVIQFISPLKNLTNLNLMCNRLSDEGVEHLKNLTSLVKLNLSLNPYITDKSLEIVKTLTNLEELNLNFCKLLTAVAISAITDTLNLKQLDMVGTADPISLSKTRPLILLAEDSKFQARMISMVLQRYNFEVEVATNGLEALEKFRENPRFDLILMDVVMPMMDGISCVKEIRGFETQNGLKPTPIIIQTADTRESQRNVCLEAGATEVLRKPLDNSCISLAKELMENSYHSLKA
eukprot:TRINITY_DN9511_c0_g1_i1.p1 TRINITY_DN9511_c0_g1~~TRINITY_DN9511_c0_g1_i1.p1  ORF type:complete len:372 (-),score=74.38 TRINITY_DN9511_c0_g1_i1:74-1189(-)